ncbi:MAG: choice-of-anchor tandem repeat GloVer-containing protein, partial [Terriglobales bacterium]
GTTAEGGTNTSGTVFKITPKGKLATLYSFCSQTNCTDGATPYAGLVRATDGNLYGTTRFGGANNSGAVFKINPEGKLTTLYSFCSQTNCADGEFPQAAPVQATNGKFYGTTSGGGANMSGTVFSLSVGLGPFVETCPTSGEVGTTVIILGTNLTGATSVSFDGTPAEFKVMSSSEVTAEVPNGATTGKVKVKMPGGTLASNLVFRMTK